MMRMFPMIRPDFLPAATARRSICAQCSSGGGGGGGVNELIKQKCDSCAHGC